MASSRRAPIKRAEGSFFPEALQSLFSRGTRRDKASSMYSGYTTRGVDASGRALERPERGEEKSICSSSSRSSSSPLLLRAVVPATGSRRRKESRERSSRIFFLRASSSRLTHRRTGLPASIICSTRFRFRSRQVASQTTITASGSPKHMKSRATSSSAECAMRE